MKISIMGKILIMTFFIVIATCASIYFTANHFLSKGFEENAEENIVTMYSIVDEFIDNLLSEYETEITIFTKGEELGQVLAAGDQAKVKELARTFQKETGVDFVTITDGTGKVIARGHSERLGEDASQQPDIAAALAGEVYAGVVSGTVVTFSLRATAPVRSNGAVVGTISLGTSLVSEKFVDSLKELLNLDVTVFKGDTRVMTTIMKEGKRAIGTKLANQEIVRTVLHEDRTFLQRNNILGTDYQTAYWPINTKGTTVGMWFIGAPLKQLAQTQKAVSNSTLFAALVITVIMLAVGYLLARSLSTPIRKTTSFATGVASGKLDLSLDVKTKDEIGTLAEALRTMVTSLKGKIAEAEEQSKRAAQETERAREATRQAEVAQARAETAKKEGMLDAAEQLQDIVEIISSASEELSAQIEESASGAEKQNQRTEETATAMEEMNASVLEVAQSASQAASTSNEATDHAKHGSDVVSDVITEIGNVHTLSGELENGMGRLGKRAEDIGNIMNVIADIADQTNLLALNAAIEAARAGEAGRGFAVVADEVRKLAEKTMSATKEVGDAISGIQVDTRANIDQVAETVKVVDISRDKARQAGETLQSILELTQSTSGQVLSIATASEEQSAASEEINQAVSEINQISEETNSTMAESAKAIMELSNQAQQLKNLIQHMRQDNS